MKVLLLTWGSRGHVQPFISLGRALGEAGHDAVIAAPAGEAALADAHGVELRPVHDPMRQLLADPLIQRAFETNFRGLRGKRLAAHVRRSFSSATPQVIEDMAAVADDDVDVIVHDPIVPGHAAHRIAAELGVPSVPACLEPMWTPTRRFRNPLVPYRLPARLNPATFLVTRLWFGGFVPGPRPGVPGFGHRDVLRRADGSPAPLLQVVSRHILPGPLDYPERVHTTGFWQLPAPSGWTPPPDLTDFLAAGDPPVYIGFGSAVGTDPGRAGNLVHDAVRAAGVRAVVVAGSGGIRSTGADQRIFTLDQAPFDWLFPRMAAIVHHGGAGTTGDALAAGRPQVICPFMTTQPFYGRRMQAIGVAPAPIPQHRLTAGNLAAAIRRVVADHSFADRAVELRHLIHAENGVANAVKVLETLA